MKPERCPFCKSKFIEGKTEFVAKVGEQIIAIKDVSAYVCENCGEAYYIPEVSRKIEIFMKKFHESKFLLHPVAAGELSFGEIYWTVSRICCKFKVNFFDTVCETNLMISNF